MTCKFNYDLLCNLHRSLKEQDTGLKCQTLKDKAVKKNECTAGKHTYHIKTSFDALNLIVTRHVRTY